MTCFVLVHGSFHGPWCWERLVPALLAAGHRVVLPDLMAAERWVAPGAHPGLADYATEVASAIPGGDERVILVGHSMGGIVASEVAERCCDRIAATVYVCGLLLRPGQSLLDFIAAHADLGVDDLVLKNMRTGDDAAIATFPAEAAAGIFYNRCTEADAAWASARLRPQPVAVYGSRLRLSDARYGMIPRYYVEATGDRAVSPLYQRAMTAAMPCRRVFTLDSDHSPFLSQTAALAEILLEIAG